MRVSPWWLQGTRWLQASDALRSGASLTSAQNDCIRRPCDCIVPEPYRLAVIYAVCDHDVHLSIEALIDVLTSAISVDTTPLL